MTSKFSLGPDRRVAIDIMKRLVRNNPDQKRVLDALLGILFKNEAALINMTDTPSAYDTGKYLKSTASGAEWGAAPTPTFYACRLTLSSQTVSTGNEWASFGAEDYDTGDWWSSGTDVTVPADGIYLFTAEAAFTFDSDSSVMRAAIEIVNNTDSEARIAHHRLSFDSPGSSIDQIFSCAGVYECSEDDVIRLRLNQIYTADKDFTDVVLTASQLDVS